MTEAILKRKVHARSTASRITRAFSSRYRVEALESRVLLSVAQDVNGWTTFDQTGSDGLRIYVSNSLGNDTTGTGSRSQPYKSLSVAASHLRAGHGDWMLLKKGDVWKDQSLPALPDGQDANFPLVVTSWDNDTGARPLIEPTANADFFNDGIVNHVALVSLAFYDYTADPTNAAYLSTRTGCASVNFTGPGGTDILLEGCSVNYGGVTVQGSPDVRASFTNVRIRRNEIMNAYSTVAHAQGIFTHDVQNMLIEGNYFEHNGWNGLIAGAQATIFNHAMYIQYTCSDVTVRDNIVVRPSATGLQLRCGGTVENNLFIDCPVGFFVATALPSAQQMTASIVRNNVVLGSATTYDQPRGEAFLDYSQFSLVENNLVADGWYPRVNGDAYSLLSPATYNTSDGLEIDSNPPIQATFRGNTAYNWPGNLLNVDGTNWGSLSNGSGLIFHDNILQDTTWGNTVIDNTNRTINAATDQYANNTFYSTTTSSRWFKTEPPESYSSLSQWVSASGATGTSSTPATFVDPTRTIETYMNSLGVTYHQYQLTSGATTWLDAQQQAEFLGGNLVTVDSGSTQSALTTTFPGQSLWIGLNDSGYGQEGNWVWDGPSAASYRNWATSQPTSGTTYNWAYLSGSNGQWYADTATATRKGVVELDEKSQFIAAMHGQSKDNWNANYTTSLLNAYFRAGFAVSGQAANAAPVVATNTGVTVALGKGIVLTAAMLNTTDANGTSADTTYLLETLPLHGSVRLNGTAMILRQTFTQADINAGRVRYEHDASSTSDSFGFRVSDGKGGITASTTFAVAMGTANAAAYTVTNAAPAISASQVFHVSDSAAAGTIIGNVLATDADTANGQRLFYSIGGSYNNINDPYRINMFTGQLITQIPNPSNKLNHGTNPVITLTIKVTDDGTIPQTTTQTITIYVDASPSVATSIALAQQPTNTTAGQSITPGVAVNVLDQYGAILTTDHSNVTIAINSQPGGATLGGTLTVAAVNGVATFSNLSLTKAGSYTLNVTDGSMASLITSSFTITPAAASQISLAQQTVKIDTMWSSQWGEYQPGDNKILYEYPNPYQAINWSAPLTASYISPIPSGAGTWSITPGAHKVLVLEVSGRVGTNSPSGEDVGTVYYGGYQMTLATSTATISSQGTFSSIYYLDLSNVTTLANGAIGNGHSFTGTVLTSYGTANTNSFSATAMVLSNVDTSKLPTAANGLGVSNRIDSSNNSATISAAHSAGSFALIGSSAQNGSGGALNNYTWTDTTDSLTPAQLYQMMELGYCNLPQQGISPGGSLSSQYLSNTGWFRGVWGGAAYLSDLPANASLTVTSNVQYSSGLIGNSLDMAVFQPFPVTATIAGQTITPGFDAKLRDQYGNLVTTSNSNVTIAINSGPTGATLGGTLTIAAVNGVATFSNLSLATAGSYTLKATSASLTLGTSGSITISPAAATKLVFSQQPTNTNAGQNITPAITVNVADQYGNVVTTDSSSVTMAINSQPGGATLGGTLTAAAANGVATFSNLSLNKTGTYTLIATDASLTSAISNSFSITGSKATPTITWANPSAITYGTALSGTQLNASGSVPGTLVYTPATGTVLGAGTQTLSATFTPTDSVNYTTATASVSLTVTQYAPSVVAVYASSTVWSVNFLNYLASHNLGSSTLGYLLSSGAGQLRALPWNNVNKISIKFSENVNVDQAAMAIVGVNVGTYAVSGFTYDSVNYAATWTLASPIGRDKLLLNLASRAVTNAAGNPLDGEWTDGSSTTSGNGTAGGNFQFRLNVLPGDVDNSGGVLSLDVNAIQNAVGSGTTRGAYSVYLDIDGSGTILSLDVNLAQSLVGGRLPAASPIFSGWNLLI